MHQLLHRGAAMTQHRSDESLDASWDDLKLFLACAKYKSFRNAAEELGLTSTTLMRRIDRLEESIGCKLFLRDQSGLTLSDEGTAMISDVSLMERHAFNVFRRASRSSSDTTGTVRVAVTEGPGNFWILPRLIDFQKTYRKITVELRCAMEQADVARLESDIQLEPPTNPDLIVAKLGRLHIYPFVSKDYESLHGVPKTLAELQSHRIIKQSAPQVDDTAYARILGLKSLEGIVGIKTNSSIGVLYAVERGAGIGFLPTVSIALGAPLVAVDLGVSHHADLWLTYHKEFRASERHKIVVDWLRKIFDPKTYPCFRDDFIHPNALVPIMEAARESVGLNGYVAASPG
jgi:DNA-binding transcriptional LysR family regulator